VPYITIKKGLCPALSSLLVPTTVWSTKSNYGLLSPSRITQFYFCDKKTTNYRFIKVYSAWIP